LGSEIRIWLEDLTKNGSSYDDELALRNNRTDIESCFFPTLDTLSGSSVLNFSLPVNPHSGRPWATQPHPKKAIPLKMVKKLVLLIFASKF